MNKRGLIKAALLSLIGALMIAGCSWFEDDPLAEAAVQLGPTTTAVTATTEATTPTTTAEAISVDATTDQSEPISESTPIQATQPCDPRVNTLGLDAIDPLGCTASDAQINDARDECDSRAGLTEILPSSYLLICYSVTVADDGWRMCDAVEPLLALRLASASEPSKYPCGNKGPRDTESAEAALAEVLDEWEIGIKFLDAYVSADGDSFFVVIGNLRGKSYCEVHLLNGHRRTGDWSNELWSGHRSQVTVEISLYGVDYPFDGYEAECS